MFVDVHRDDSARVVQHYKMDCPLKNLLAPERIVVGGFGGSIDLVAAGLTGAFQPFILDDPRAASELVLSGGSLMTLLKGHLLALEQRVLEKQDVRFVERDTIRGVTVASSDSAPVLPDVELALGNRKQSHETFDRSSASPISTEVASALGSPVGSASPAESEPIDEVSNLLNDLMPPELGAFLDSLVPDSVVPDSLASAGLG